MFSQDTFYKRLVSALFALLLSFVSFSQEVNLEVAGNREIEPAYRLSKQPKLIDTVIPYSEIQYPLLSLKYETAFALDTIKAAKIKLVDKLPDIYPGYVRVGVGSKFMPLAEVFYNSVRSRKLVYGAHLKHLSSFGSIPGYAPAQFDRTQLNLAATLNENKYSVDGRMHFNSMGLHHYGFAREDAPKDSIAQRFSDFGMSFLYSKHKKDSLTFNYSAGLKYNYSQDKQPSFDSLYHARENYVNLHGTAWYKLRKEIVSADVELIMNQYNRIDGTGKKDYSLADTPVDLIFRLAPNITTYAQNNRLKVKFGANLNVNSHFGKGTIYIAPDIELKYSMFDDILIPYLEIKGGLVQNTFKSLAGQNEFILSNIPLENEYQVINTSLGIKGTLSNTIMFNANARFGVVKDKALFVTDTLFSGGNRFNVVYEDMNIASIQGSLIYQSSEKLKIEGIGTFYSYMTKNYIYAWNLPQIQVVARGYYKVMDNLSVQLDANLEGGRYAQVYTEAESDRVENLQFAKKLGFITDLNLGAEYLYSQRLSAFLQFNNLAAQRYKRWYNYPVQGFQVMGGVTFKF
ncbi:MAG: hypothetical protein K0R65_1317 [Crocinitomicaceae bacterium]|jgi:hypothetical protein|nr:hypothetical protein [Crocinitomicaceae bacterium]